LKRAITGDLKNILNENENNVSPSNLCKIWGKIGLPLKTIFELPYKG
jgi:hypothetical protein